jgi:hypothetical protein
MSELWQVRGMEKTTGEVTSCQPPRCEGKALLFVGKRDQPPSSHGCCMISFPAAERFNELFKYDHRSEISAFSTTTMEFLSNPLAFGLVFYWAIEIMNFLK